MWKIYQLANTKILRWHFGHFLNSHQESAATHNLSHPFIDIVIDLLLPNNKIAIKFHIIMLIDIHDMTHFCQFTQDTIFCENSQFIVTLSMFIMFLCFHFSKSCYRHKTGRHTYHDYNTQTGRPLVSRYQDQQIYYILMDALSTVLPP